MSLRKAINELCKSCGYDRCAPGTWRQQVTLCTCQSCPLWHVRPRGTSDIAQTVLLYYGVNSEEYQELLRKLA